MLSAWVRSQENTGPLSPVPASSNRSSRAPWAPSKKQCTISRTSSIRRVPSVDCTSPGANPRHDRENEENLPSTQASKQPTYQGMFHTFYTRDGPDTFMTQETSARNGDVLFRVTLNGNPVVGYHQEPKSWDKIQFSCSLLASQGRQVLIHRFQLPAGLRSQGLGTRILKILLDAYRKAGCLKVVVALPTQQGVGLYTKLGFVRTSLRDNSMHLDLVEESLRPDYVQDSSEAGAAPEIISSDSSASEDDDFDGNESLSAQDEASDCSPADYQHQELASEESSEDVLAPPCKPRGSCKDGYLQRPAGMRSKRALQKGSGLLGSLRDNEWDVQRHGHHTSPYVTLKELRSGESFNVRVNRAPKAKMHLTYASCTQPLQLGSCQCRRNCNRVILDPAAIRRLRVPVFCGCEDEHQVNAFLVDRLAVSEGKPVIMVGNEARKVCPTYYASIYGVAEKRVKKCMRWARNGAKLNACRPLRAGGSSRRSDPEKYTIAFCFWFMFFEENCQRPNDEIRLFPTEKTYKEIYSEYFSPWFSRQVENGDYSKDKKPSFSTWKRARRAETFADVQERAKHTHGRCSECAALSSMLLEAFKDGATEHEYRQRRRLHDEEVTQWRQMEGVLKARGISNPDRVQIIMHDGTQATGVPRCTHRTIKNLDPFRMEVVPWLGLDMSGGKRDYIYSRKTATPKDSNTLISEVHAMVRRAKSDYSHPRHLARELILIADSASENKNNVLFAYCADLVENKWYDSVDLVFGPVGHTHNGVDATHKIHNQNVGSHFSGDLGHFVFNYKKGFSGSEHQIPAVSILDRTVDWAAYYTPHMRPIAGFTKTKNDPIAVRGFRIARAADNTVDLRWKIDPASELEWRGAGGYPNTPGFFLLKSVPVGLPAFVKPPVLSQEQKEACKKLLSKSMRSTLQTQGLEACAQWNYEAATEDHIPVHAYLEEESSPYEWGRLCEIGAVEGKRGKVRILKDFWNPDLGSDRKALWTLPKGERGEEVAATSNLHHFSGDQELMDRRRLPSVRYAGEKARSCEVSRHPNNVDGGWRQEEVTVPDQHGDGDRNNQEDNEEEKTNPSSALDRPTSRPAWYYEVDFQECKQGLTVVGLAESTEGPSPYIFVGKILSVDPEKRTFRMQRWQCNKDTWLATCLEGKWFAPQGRSDDQEYPHYSVLKYIKSVNKSGTLPKQVIRDIEDRNISWYKQSQ